MGSIASCACGWTLVSPQGEQQAAKHLRIHLGDIHPEISVRDEEIRNMIKSV